MCLILWLFSLQLVYLLKNTDYFYEIAILIAPLLDGFRPKIKKDVEIPRCRDSLENCLKKKVVIF
jgi:hypothetical protein